jgi:opacity protein-like surface antigen
MHVKKRLLILTFVLFVPYIATAETRTYFEFQMQYGLYKHKTPGEPEYPTRMMPGFALTAGFTTALNDVVHLRGEATYTFGYQFLDYTNWSSVTVRGGFEIHPTNKRERYNLIPYFLLGGGIFAVDPPDPDVWTAPGWDATSGVRLTVTDNISLSFGFTYMFTAMRHPEWNSVLTKHDRLIVFAGITRLF